MFVLAVTQPGEIVERMLDKLFAARILSLWCVGEHPNKKLRHCCSLRPGFGRSRREKFVELLVATLHGELLSLEPKETLTANRCGLLSGHAAALVEVNRIRWVVRHGAMPFIWLLLKRVFAQAPYSRLPELRSAPDNTA